MVLASRCLVITALLVTSPLRAADLAEAPRPARFTLVSGQRSLGLAGELELELHDIQGRGGVGHDSPSDTRTLGTRSPFMEIDALHLALSLGLDDGLGATALLALHPAGAYLAAAWIEQ